MVHPRRIRRARQRAKKEQLEYIIMFRGLGFSQQEIAEQLDVSRQTVAYQLQKLKREAMLKGAEETYREKLPQNTSQEEKNVDPYEYILEKHGITKEQLDDLGILENEENEKEVVGPEIVKKTILEALSEKEWVALPIIHFKLARTFLQLDGPTNEWKRGWPTQLKEKLGWEGKLRDEMLSLMGTDVEMNGATIHTELRSANNIAVASA